MATGLAVREGRLGKMSWPREHRTPPANTEPRMHREAATIQRGSLSPGSPSPSQRGGQKIESGFGFLRGAWLDAVAPTLCTQIGEEPKIESGFYFSLFQRGIAPITKDVAGGAPPDVLLVGSHGTLKDLQQPCRPLPNPVRPFRGPAGELPTPVAASLGLLPYPPPPYLLTNILMFLERPFTVISRI